MKLSEVSVGCRFRKSVWPAHHFIDIYRVGKFYIRGTDHEGNSMGFLRDEMDTDWQMIGDTDQFKKPVGGEK